MTRHHLFLSVCAALVTLATVGCGSGGGELSPPSSSVTPAPEQPAQPTTEPGTPPSPSPTSPAPQQPEPAPAPSEPTPTEPAPIPVPRPNPDPIPAPDPKPEPAPVQDTDAFGVKMLYPSKSGGEAWSLAADPTKDARFDPQGTITKNADGSWKMKSSQVRMSVFTSTGYSAKKIPSYDPDVLASRGYMQAPNDWKNIEMTGFVKLNGVSDTGDNFDWYARGGKHNDDLACEGTSYKAGLHYDGRARYQKESWHVSYEQAGYKPATKALKGRWVGFKAVMRNTQANNGKEAVRLEMWLNDNADKVSWTRVYDMVDDGTWGGDTKRCGGGAEGMPFTWGGPIAVFRWDSATDVDFKWMSVREIQP